LLRRLHNPGTYLPEIIGFLFLLVFFYGLAARHKLPQFLKTGLLSDEERPRS